MVDATCAWCGSTPLSREDLVPVWLSDVLATAFGTDDGYDFGFDIIATDGERTSRTHPQRRPEVVVKAVCRTCNNGWMSALEGAVKPYLKPMVLGEEIRLSTGAQATLARWAAKVAVLLGHYQAVSFAMSHGDLRQIHVGGNAPIGWHIRLAYRTDPGVQPFDFFVSGHYAAPAGTIKIASDVPANSFSATLAFGHIVIAAVGGPGIENHARWINGSDRPLTIWPPTTQGIKWPPASPVITDHGALREFHELFWTGIINNDFPRPDAHNQTRAKPSLQ